MNLIDISFMKNLFSEKRRWGENRHKSYHRSKWVEDKELIKCVVQEARGKEKNGLVVDLGCGLGHLLAAFADTANKCVGVDADSNMLERAVRNDKIEYICERVENFSGLKADVVVSRNTLHYIPGNTLISISNKLLKPGGIVVLAQAVPPTTAVRVWHDQLHDLLSVNHVCDTDDMVAFCRSGKLEDIRAKFCFHRMHVEEWLNARVESDDIRSKVIDHHKMLSQFPEYEAAFSKNMTEVTVRFSIVSACRVS